MPTGHGVSAAATRPGAAGLVARVRVPRRLFDVDIELTVPAGTVTAILGPNGAGKSTVLQALSGDVPAIGSIRLGDRQLLDSARGLVVPMARRRIASMTQDPLLFPHLSVADNVAFGPRARRVPRRRAAELADEWLRRLDLPDAARRRPAELSGGQQQRVALARALAAEPDLLLLDEPLAAADVQTAAELRQLLRRHLSETGQTTLLVTHQVLDAAVLADRIVVLQDGAVVDEGPAARVLAEPATAFAAALAGVNLLLGAASETPSGRRLTSAPRASVGPASGAADPEPGPFAGAVTARATTQESDRGAILLRLGAGLAVRGHWTRPANPGGSAAAAFAPAAVTVRAAASGSATVAADAADTVETVGADTVGAGTAETSTAGTDTVGTSTAETSPVGTGTVESPAVGADILGRKACEPTGVAPDSAGLPAAGSDSAGSDSAGSEAAGSGPAGSEAAGSDPAANRWPAVVTGVVPGPAGVRLHLQLTDLSGEPLATAGELAVDLTPAELLEQDLTPGSRVSVAVPPEAIRLYPL
ncbi:ATP-binding cassette domain-containing protein [Nakamurella aerolata]|uniref:ATP-binding cassette domain-containing protein n=1 Tax=Nakamurella aerolata TaxID=1656892 RepID=UPI001BB0FF5B